jgi:succinate dehydrogenase/fumarate reductase flavoprotein subunit
MSRAQSYAADMIWMLSWILACAGDTDSAVDSSATDSGEVETGSRAPVVAVDVLIVGSGPAGLSAAWEARLAGASVLVLERDEKSGGAGFMAANLFAVGTRHQRAEGVEDSPEKAASEWAAFTRGGDPSDPWVQRLLYESSSVLNWLVDEIGSDMLGLHSDPSAGYTRRIHAVSIHEKHPLHTIADALETEIWLSHEATALVLGNNRVLGAQFDDLRTGETGWIQAQETILATGGFARDRDRLLADRPEIAELTVLYETYHLADGGGQALFEDANAAAQNPGAFGLYTHSLADWRTGLENEAIWPSQIRQSLIVDLNGNRVASEFEAHGFGLQAELLVAPEKRLFALFPEEVWQQQKLIIPGYNQIDGDEIKILEGEEAIDNGAAFAHNTLTDVAAHWKMDTVTLAETLATYEAATAAGHDPEFDKAPSDLIPFGGAPIVSAELFLGAAKAFGGAELDPNTRVLDANGESIPGLWAAGEAAGMLGTPAVGGGFSGSVTACYLTGRIAGQNAAAAALAY